MAVKYLQWHPMGAGWYHDGTDFQWNGPFESSRKATEAFVASQRRTTFEPVKEVEHAAPPEPAMIDPLDLPLTRRDLAEALLAMRDSLYNPGGQVGLRNILDALREAAESLTNSR